MTFKSFWKIFIAEREAVQLLKTADRLSKEEIDDIQALIKRMQRENKSASAIISYLQKYNDKISEYYKAKRVFDTENKNLQTESVIHSAENLDLNKFQVLIGPDACPVCRKKTDNGKKIFDESEITKDGYGHRPPFHPHCVLPDTVIYAPDSMFLMKAHYSGNIVNITLADGRKLSVTENHMILTDRGFARANLLSQGDNVISSALTEGIVSKNPDHDNVISTISDVFDASLKSLGRTTHSMPASPEYFHGDGRFCYGNIDIIFTDSLLRNTLESRILKHIENYFLDSAKFPVFFDSRSNLASMLIALSLAADGIVSGFNISEILSFSPSTMNELQRFFNTASYNARIEKAAMYRNSTNPQTVSNALLAFSPVVRFDNIIGVEIAPYHGDVYDVNTMSTVYTTNGIISSNCYCVLIPH